jgi:chromosomal replication initiator protein
MKTAPSDLDTATRVIAIITSALNISTTELESPSHRWKIVWPRQVAIFLIRRYTRLSTIKIGLLFNRDHATVLQSLKAVANQVATNPAAARQLADLDQQVRALNLQPQTVRSLTFNLIT